MTAPPPEQPPDQTSAAPRWTPLAPNPRRVLGVLIEKAKTTPAGYPMTVNAIVTGCNQKNNRDPVTALDTLEVERAIEDLRAAGAVSEIDWLGRAAKFKHHAYEWMGVNRQELAVMAELLLRGPQTLGELRARAARMEPIPDLAALEPIVNGLLERRLMIALTPPGRGQMVSHNLYLPPELEQLGAHGGQARAALADERAQPRPQPASGLAAGAADDTSAMLHAIAELRAEVARLEQRVKELERRYAVPSD